MKAADDGANLVLAGKPARVSHRVDDAGVTAPAQHHQPPITEAQHQRLVVEDQRIRLPAVLAERLMPGKPGLERRLPVDLTRDEHCAVEQKRRLAFLHDRESHLLERSATSGWELGRKQLGKTDPSAAPELRMEIRR